MNDVQMPYLNVGSIHIVARAYATSSDQMGDGELSALGIIVPG